jgi:hypothetical protein
MEGEAWRNHHKVVVERSDHVMLMIKSEHRLCGRNKQNEQQNEERLMTDERERRV